MPPPPLDVVPESVVFRGVDVGQAGVKRTLLLKNTSSRLLEGLLTHPLSGAFELKLPEASADGAPGRAVEEPGFFHSFTLSPNETLKVTVVFCPDNGSVSEHKNFQDTIIVNAAGGSVEVPIKACRDASVPFASLRRTGAPGPGDFWPPTEELASWVAALLEELSLMPHGPEGGGAEGMREAEDGAEGNAKHIVPESVSPASMGRLVGDDKEAAAERERRRAAVEAANAQLPPTGLSMRRPEHQQAEVDEEAIPGTRVLQPAVVVMGRTAFSTIKKSPQGFSLPSSSCPESPATSRQSQEPKQVLYIIDNGLIDARGQQVDVAGMSPAEVRERYTLVQCNNNFPAGPVTHRLSTAPGKPPTRNPPGKGAASRPTTEGRCSFSLTSGVPSAVLELSAPGGVNPVSLAEAAAKLGMTLEDLPPPATLKATAAAIGEVSFRPGSGMGRLPPLIEPPSSSSSSGGDNDNPGRDSRSQRPSSIKQRQVNDNSASPRNQRIEQPAMAARRQVRLAAPIKAAAARSCDDQAKMEANWDALA